MLGELPRRPKEDFVVPDKVIKVKVDSLSGYPEHDGFPSREDYFIEGTQPRTADPIHLKLKVCKGKPGLATPDDVQSGNYEEKEYIRLVESDPVSGDGKNRWQAGIDVWISQQPDKEKYSPPGDYCRSDGLVNVGIDSPAHQSTVGNNFEVIIKTNSVKKIVEVKLWVDGTEKNVWTERPFNMNLSLANGVHKIKVRATDKDGNYQEREAVFGVNVAWDWAPSPTPTVTPAVTVTPSPLPTAVPTATVLPTATPVVSPIISGT